MSSYSTPFFTFLLTSFTCFGLRKMTLFGSLLEAHPGFERIYFFAVPYFFASWLSVELFRMSHEFSNCSNRLVYLYTKFGAGMKSWLWQGSEVIGNLLGGWVCTSDVWGRWWRDRSGVSRGRVWMGDKYNIETMLEGRPPRRTVCKQMYDAGFILNGYVWARTGRLNVPADRTDVQTYVYWV